MQPYHTEVGAGTSNPATLLRVLGPEPWRTAYVEPSIRPDDGRYGENPYRFQQHFQYQVILKPAPADVQDLYLGSLRAIGIDPADARRALRRGQLGVAQRWARGGSAGRCGWTGWRSPSSPTSSRPAASSWTPVSVELTYGLERIAMYLQGVRRAHDMEWAPGVTYGDVYESNERQFSAYNFEVADTAMLARHFDDHEAEAGRCLDADLPLPAYDQVLKCSHAVQPARRRRAIAVTDRQAYILRMRATGDAGRPDDGG